MLKFNNKIPSAITIGGKEVERVRMMNEIVWERSSEPVDVDYFYIENLYSETNTLTLTSTKSGSPSSDLYSDTVEYSKDKNNWTTVNFDTSTPYNITMNSGEKVYFRNDSGRWNYNIVPPITIGDDIYFYTSFNANQNCGAGGDLRSLLNYKNINNVVLTEGCFYSLFKDCSTLKKAPELRATTLAHCCYMSIFRNCSSLNEVKTFANDISASYCTSGWLYGVASTGTVYNYGSATYRVDSTNGIPTGWTEAKS